MKNPNRLLVKIRRYVNKNLRDVINNQKDSIIPPVPKKYLPSESPLRLLYNEIYYNHYAGLSYSAISLCNVFIERLTKILYNHFKPKGYDSSHIKQNGRGLSWWELIDDLKTYFNENDIPEKDVLVSLMSDFDYYRGNIRNLVLHGKVEEYLHSTLLEYKAVNVMTLQREEIKLKYDPNINEDKKNEILMGRMTSDTHNLLILISIVLHKY
jgi:hypothetical protein